MQVAILHDEMLEISRKYGDRSFVDTVSVCETGKVARGLPLFTV